MAHNIIMPKTGMAMEEGTVVRWLKKAGDAVSKGEAIAVIETDKVTMDLEADYEGTLLAVVHGDGDVVKATHTIAWIGAPGEKVPTVPETETSRQPLGPESYDAAAGRAPAGADTLVSAPGGKPPATPAARAYASRAGIALSSVAGTGPGGAIRLRDVTALAQPSAPARPGQGESIPMTGMRRVIAEKMLRSHQQIPSVTLITRADVTELSVFRARINAAGAETSGNRGVLKVSYTDFILRAVALALREHPLLNSVVEGDRVVAQSEINIGIAVALETGLIVPVVRGADELSVRQIAASTRELADRARSGTLGPAECAGGTFTISNLGMYGVTEFTPLINIPESAILGVGAIEEALRTAPAGGIESRKLMSLCLTHDHRHIDGAPAAAFLGRIKALLESCWSLIV